MASVARRPAPDLADIAYERLRELIVHGRVAPGSRIIEIDVADRLQMSRTPVRGALRRLLQEGYVVRVRGEKRVQLAVAPLTAEDGEELFLIVGELEGLAARLAARQPRSQRSNIVREMKEANDCLRELATARGPDAWTLFDLHTEFHLAFVRRAAGPRLLGLHEAITPQIERYRRVYSHALGGNILPSIQEHELIITAIQEGDEEAAATAARENWGNAAVRLRNIIEVAGERGAW